MNKKVLILSGIPWNATIQRHHNLALFLKKSGCEVFFVESIPSSKFTFNKLLKRIKKTYINLNEKPDINNNGITVINQRFLNPMGGIFWIVNRLKARKLIKSIGNNFDIVINYLPINTTNYILENIIAENVIYDCVRDFENWGGYPSNIKEYEKLIIAKANLILTDSYYLTDKIKNKYIEKKNIQILPTIDNVQINTLKKCQLRKSVSNILYFGTVGGHIDINILNNLAEEGYRVHIIGEVYPEIRLNSKIIIHGFISDLRELAKKIVEVADAIIIPYKGNMDGVIPAKLMQCLATGLPIYINEFYDSKVLNEFLYVYKTYSDLKFKLENYNRDDHTVKKDMMRHFVLENSQENQFKKLETAIKKDGINYKNTGDGQ